MMNKKHGESKGIWAVDKVMLVSSDRFLRLFSDGGVRSKVTPLVSFILAETLGRG